MHPETRYNTEGYLVFKPNYLRRHPYCEMLQCFRPAVQIHHKKGHGRHGSRLCDERFLMAICMECHRWIHDHTKEARKAGLLLDTLDIK